MSNLIVFAKCRLNGSGIKTVKPKNRHKDAKMINDGKTGEG